MTIEGRPWPSRAILFSSRYSVRFLGKQWKRCSGAEFMFSSAESHAVTLSRFWIPHLHASPQGSWTRPAYRYHVQNAVAAVCWDLPRDPYAVLAHAFGIPIFNRRIIDLFMTDLFSAWFQKQRLRLESLKTPRDCGWTYHGMSENNFRGFQRRPTIDPPERPPGLGKPHGHQKPRIFPPVLLQSSDLNPKFLPMRGLTQLSGIYVPYISTSIWDYVIHDPKMFGLGYVGMVYYWVDMGFPHTLKAYNLRFGQSNSKQSLRKFGRCFAKTTAPNCSNGPKVYRTFSLSSCEVLEKWSAIIQHH